jgi:hypothetical protein
VLVTYLSATILVSRFVYRHIEAPWVDTGRRWSS